MNDYFGEGLVWSSEESDDESAMPASPVDTAESPVEKLLPTGAPPVMHQGFDAFLNLEAINEASLTKRKRDFVDEVLSSFAKKHSIWSPGVLPLNPMVVPLLPSTESFQLSVVAGDGDCFFSSVALALRDVHQPALTAQVLRELAVNYIRSNPQRYQPFFDERENMSSYLVDMHRPGTWADARVMHALVNWLQIRIEIFDISGQHCNTPVLYAMECDTPHPVHTFTVRLQRSGAEGREHYDAITPVNANSLPQPALR